MEIKISSENVLWLLSVALTAIGLVMLVVGLIFAFAADDLEGVLKAMAGIVGGIAFAVIPHSLASSVSNLRGATNENEDAETGGE